MDCDGECPCPTKPQPTQAYMPTLVPLSTCQCPEYYYPVCGVDGQIYDNDCLRVCEYVLRSKCFIIYTHRIAITYKITKNTIDF